MIVPGVEDGIIMPQNKTYPLLVCNACGGVGVKLVFRGIWPHEVAHIPQAAPKIRPAVDERKREAQADSCAIIQDKVEALQVGLLVHAGLCGGLYYHGRRHPPSARTAD